MSGNKKAPEQATLVMDAESMAAAIRRIAQEIVKANPDVDSLALMGILRRGRPLADRFADHVAAIKGIRPRVGSLATTLYRDDLRAGIGCVKPRLGETHFDFAAGRTIRAAMDEVMDYGRPARIQLACLVDRGGRELPIQPDYLGEAITARPGEYVSVRFVETDGEDAVILGPKGEEHDAGSI
jgi:pyrimidine operon attenuation protein/uracil phosphoribosyltransferase